MCNADPTANELDALIDKARARGWSELRIIHFVTEVYARKERKAKEKAEHEAALGSITERQWEAIREAGYSKPEGQS